MILALALPLAAGVNSSIRVEPGERVNKDLSTVNGQIRIGDGATVRGEAESVNGSIEIGREFQWKTAPARARWPRSTVR
jgi:hypothetical protein